MRFVTSQCTVLKFSKIFKLSEQLRQRRLIMLTNCNSLILILLCVLRLAKTNIKVLLLLLLLLFLFAFKNQYSFVLITSDRFFYYVTLFLIRLWLNLQYIFLIEETAFDLLSVFLNSIWFNTRYVVSPLCNVLYLATANLIFLLYLAMLYNH